MKNQLMRNYIAIVVLILTFSCQVLDKREINLSSNFCKSCTKPLQEMLLANEAIYVVKINSGKLFYNYDKDKINVDSLELELMKKGFLPRQDSIIMYPVCCNHTQQDSSISKVKE